MGPDRNARDHPRGGMGRLVWSRPRGHPVVRFGARSARLRAAPGSATFGYVCLAWRSLRWALMRHTRRTFSHRKGLVPDAASLDVASNVATTPSVKSNRRQASGTKKDGSSGTSWTANPLSRKGFRNEQNSTLANASSHKIRPRWSRICMACKRFVGSIPIAST